MFHYIKELYDSFTVKCDSVAYVAKLRPLRFPILQTTLFYFFCHFFFLSFFAIKNKGWAVSDKKNICIYLNTANEYIIHIHIYQYMYIMNFFEFVGIFFVFYGAVYFFLWTFLDCNVALWLKIRLGHHISSLRGQVVWITGASSGIGKGLALNLARHGVRLVLSARREELLEEVKEECLAEARGLLAAKDVLVLPLDMLKLDNHTKCLMEVLNHFGKLDILVNNAGRSQRASWEDIDVEVDRDLFELDVFSVLHLSRLVVRYFMEQAGGRGHIAVTSSVAGLTPVPFSASYCGAKHALNAYIRCLSIEQPSLDVTIFCPGPVATDFLKEAFTAKSNDKVGLSTKDQKRLSIDRCGFLFATALANRMELVWCGLFPVNLLAYVSRYSLLTLIVQQFMTQSTLKNIREGKF